MIGQTASHYRILEKVGMRGGALRLALLAIILSATTGCASKPPFRTHPELPWRGGAIRTVGVLPPAIQMAEEQAGVAANKVVPSLEWSAVADRANIHKGDVEFTFFNFRNLNTAGIGRRRRFRQSMPQGPW